MLKRLWQWLMNVLLSPPERSGDYEMAGIVWDRLIYKDKRRWSKIIERYRHYPQVYQLLLQTRAAYEQRIRDPYVAIDLAHGQYADALWQRAKKLKKKGY